MLGFEVLVNGQKLCVAGTKTSSVLAIGVSWARREPDLVRFNVGGVTAGDVETHFFWKTPTIAAGDEVTIRLVNVENPDPPEVTYKPAHDHRD